MSKPRTPFIETEALLLASEIDTDEGEDRLYTYIRENFTRGEAIRLIQTCETLSRALDCKVPTP